MSKFSQKEQSNIVGMAAELEAAIIIEKEELISIKQEKFLLPEGPKMKEIKEPQYIKNKIPKNKAELFSEWASKNGGLFKFLFKHKYLPIKILLIVLLVACIAFYLFFYLTTFAGSEFVETNSGTSAFCIVMALVCFGLFWVVFGINKSYQRKYFSSADWKAAVENEKALANEKLRAEYMVKYSEAKREYDIALEKYNEELPALQKEMTIWQKSHDAKLAIVENDLNENIDALNSLYSTTQLIPSSYRTVDRLTWLYEDMSTSEHDIERSIDLLNSKEIKEELVNIQGHIDDMRRDLREGFIGIYAAIQEGSSIQSEMLTNLENIRKSARIGNFMNVGNLLQNHNRNKVLSQINNKM